MDFFCYSKKPLPRPIQVEPHSRIDTWRRDSEKSVSSVAKPLHQPMYIQARSKTDTWTTESRSQTVPTHRMVRSSSSLFK